MEMIYNSPNYVVVEFASPENETADGYGFEIVDKQTRRELYLAGDVADLFRHRVQELIASSPSMEDVDDFLSQYDAFMQRPVTLH